MSQKQKKPVEVIVFNNPNKKKSDSQTSKPSQSAGKNVKNQHEEEVPSPSFSFDQRKAKYDVRKLAISSMKKTAKEDAMVDLLVELGAKRPKNKCLHPKDYMKQLKRKQEEEKEEELRNGGGSLSKKKKQQKRRRDKDDLLNFVDGQKGWYKDGVQYVTK